MIKKNKNKNGEYSVRIESDNIAMCLKFSSGYLPVSLRSELPKRQSSQLH